jgi:hypothetical protein
MSKITRTGPSPAMVVAAVALSFAVAGTAVAGTDALKRAVTKSKVKQVAKKQANKVLNSRESQLNVNSAKSADNADKLDNLNSTDFLRSNAVAADGNADSADIDNFTTTTYTTVLSEPFTAPSAGFALITTAVGAADDASLAGAGALYTRVAIDTTATTADDFNSPAFYLAPSDGGTGTNTVVVPVTAGDHTANVQARAGGTGAYIFSRQITVLFVPSGDAGPVPYNAPKDGAGKGALGQD